MARRVCLSIGVSEVTPPPGQALRFGYLDGAVIAARSIGEWALRSGFGEDNVRIVTDEKVARKPQPVTRERVQEAVDALFPPGAETASQLLLSFCGHGITDPNFGAISWLFSDSVLKKYRVLATAFYEELFLHGIERITLITDACREGPKDLDLMRLDPVRGIVVQGDQPDDRRLDRLAACQDGQIGYMVSERNSAAPGKCVFSGVIADVLWGREPAAIENGLLTTTSLGAVARKRSSERAKAYRLKLNPDCLVDPEEAVLYDSARPLGDFDLQPWPPQAEAATMGSVARPAAAAGHEDAAFERLHADSGFRAAMLGPGFGAGRIALAGAAAFAFPARSKPLVRDLVALRRPAAKTAAGKPVVDSQRVQMALRRLEADAAGHARERQAQDVRRSLVQIRPASGPDGSNLIVTGRAAAIWSARPVSAGRRTSARAGFRVEPDHPGAPVLVEFEDGDFAPVVPYRRLYTIVKRNPQGDIYQAYGESGSRDAFQQGLKALADFAAGRLDAARLDALAAQLRRNKHADPVLGAICAYLYRAAADVDSICRMAFFYVQRDQPVPFDIALLGEMKVTADAKGRLRLSVPAVKARQGRAGEGRLPDYVTAATPAAKADIGGRCPWLALGWDYVGLARADWQELVAGLSGYADKVRRSGFTCLPRETGLTLAESWKLVRRPASGE